MSRLVVFGQQWKQESLDKENAPNSLGTFLTSPSTSGMGPSPWSPSQALSSLPEENLFRPCVAGIS